VGVCRGTRVNRVPGMPKFECDVGDDVEKYSQSRSAVGNQKLNLGMRQSRVGVETEGLVTVEFFTR
jgi:hypothetical protein